MSQIAKTKIAVFPLPGIVLFPNSLLPLHIFEPRYRRMLDDLMAGDRQFVLLNTSEQELHSGTLGCVAEVIQVERLRDGRSNILTVGRERARLLECFQDQPYLQATVEVVRDDPAVFAGGEPVEMLRSNVAELSRLTKTVYGRDVDDLLRTDLSAEELSFLVAGLLIIDPFEQQRLLEMTGTAERIVALESKLSFVSKKLAALAAIENAFKPG